MANAAPFIASPSRRVAAGMMDFVLAMMAAGLVAGVADALDYPANQLELAMLAYAIYHAAFYWIWDGQTPGLRTFDMRTVGVAGAELSALQACARAGLRPLLLYGGGTVASKLLAPDVAAVLVISLLFGELGMMFTLPTRQTLSDVLSRTLVVNVPPPQPHRAPAAPMYSATDAEFGLPPRHIK